MDLRSKWGARSWRWYLLPHRFTTIRNCVITQNRGTATRFLGQSAGGIYGTDTNVHITGCTVTQNQGCGAIFEGERAWTFNTLQSTTLANCTISENTNSGVICQDLAPVTIKECTVFKNGGRGIVCTFSHAAFCYQLPY